MSEVLQTCNAVGRNSKKQFTVWLMNAWCYPLMVLLTLVGILVFPVVLLLGRLLLRWPIDRLMRWYIWIYGRFWLLLMSPFVRFRRQQMENVSPGEPGLFVVNHLSFFDTYCMALLPAFDIVFAVRAWPFKMFWYAQFMRLARYMNVEESSWDETLANCKRAFDGGGTVLFFPEGSRSRSGELQRFYSGGFKAAIDAGVPLVPLVIDGTNRLLPPGSRLLHPCRVTLRALPPIATEGYQTNDGPLRLRKLVKEQMTAALADIRENGREVK